MQPEFNLPNIPELAAPAGDFEKLQYALAYGADAVYAGQPKFSLRARENGFADIEDIRRAIEYTHSLGKKLYLTSNVFPKNNKVNKFRDSIRLYSELGPDAVIMSDPGMIQYTREHFPNLEIHLSVQANCTNWPAAEFWAKQGIKRVILCRELSLPEISEIHEKVPQVELEVFAHGAMCVAVSGRCLLSNYFSRRDSNQGVCSNACREPYELYQGKEENGFFLVSQSAGEQGLMKIDEDAHGTYILNSKDLCTLGFLDQIMNAGVSSLKIEGRTKSVYYVSQAVRCYRGALDDIRQGRPIGSEFLSDILKLDSRGYFPGFFLKGSGQLSQNYETSKVQSQSGRIAGLVRGEAESGGRIRISVKGQIKAGDVLQAVWPGGKKPVSICGLRNSKGRSMDKIDPGLEDCTADIGMGAEPFMMLISEPVKGK